MDYRKDDVADGSRRFDLVIDIGGRTSISRLRRTLEPKGTLVIIGGEGDRWIGGIQRQAWAGLLSAFVPQKLGAFVVKENADELRRINELVAAGQVRPIMGPAFTLEDGARAVASFESGQAEGRLVIYP
jgi:NADPH:quinone reductase-like Zn-dependent oxidoreductase